MQSPSIEARSTDSTARAAIDWPSVGDFDPTRIIRFRHNLHEEPLLEMPSLRSLAKRLYGKGHVKFKGAKPGNVHDLFLTENSHAAGYSIDEVFDRIADPASWLAIYELNEDKTYAAFCRNLLAEIQSHVGARDPGMYGPDLAIFLSSPPAFTPYHIDQHPVFFFQIAGRKRLNLWDSSDADVLPPHLAEEFLCEKTEGIIKYRDSIQGKAIDFELGPGDGVYWPATTPHLTHTEPHWVSSDDAFSLSFNISYYTESTRRRVCISALNQLLRRHTPLPVVPYGRAPMKDTVKFPLGRAYLALRRLVKRRYLRPEQEL